MRPLALNVHTLNFLWLITDQFPKTFSSMSHLVTVVTASLSVLHPQVFTQRSQTPTTHEINTRTFYPAAPCTVANMGVFNIISLSAQRTKSRSVGKRVQRLRSESLWPPGRRVCENKAGGEAKRFSWIWDLLRLEGPLMLLVARWQRNIKSVFDRRFRLEGRLYYYTNRFFFFLPQ